MSEPFVFLGVPAYDAIEPMALDGLACAASKTRWFRKIECTSLLPHTFNCLWRDCLNNRSVHGFTHFAMIHADIQAPPDWIDTLLEEMQRVDADVLSVVSPIKDDRGLTSCGSRKGNGNVRRLVMREVMRLPETFTAADFAPGEDLMVNTALWIAKLERPWVFEFPGFSILSAVAKDDEGKFLAQVLPEDWHWSGFLAEKGVRVFLTRKIKIQHWGKAHFANDKAWGSCEADVPDNMT